MANPVLRQARKDLGLTLKRLSEQTGISISQISRYETGSKDNELGVAELIEFSRRLGVPIPDLIGPYLNADDHRLLAGSGTAFVDPTYVREPLVVLLAEHLGQAEAETTADRLLAAAHRLTWPRVRLGQKRPPAPRASDR